MATSVLPTPTVLRTPLLAKHPVGKYDDEKIGLHIQLLNRRIWGGRRDDGFDPLCEGDINGVFYFSSRKKSPPSNTPLVITFIASDLTGNNASNSNDFNLVCVVRTDGSRNSPNGRDVRNNW